MAIRAFQLAPLCSITSQTRSLRLAMLLLLVGAVTACASPLDWFGASVTGNGVMRTPGHFDGIALGPAGSLQLHLGSTENAGAGIRMHGARPAPEPATNPA